jgi:hypothetical protein
MDEMKQQMDQFQRNFKAEDFAKDFKVDPKQAEELRRQAEALRDQLKMEDFKVDPKQMDEMKQQMDQFKQNFKLQAPNSEPM